MVKRKKKKKVLLTSKIVASLLILFAAIFVTVITICDILPTKYLVLMQIGIFGITLLNSWILFDKKFKIWIKSFIIFLSSLYIILYSIGLIYIQKTYDFMDKIKYRGYITERYYVLVNIDSNYTNIKDLENKVVGTYNEKLELYDEAINKYKEQVTSELKEYTAIDTMSRKLMENSIDAIILSESHKETMETDLEEFKDKVKVLYEIDIKVKKDDALEHPKINVQKEAFTIFIAGSDSRGDISKRSNCDVNMLVTVNPNTYEILMVSIPRDYYVQLHGTTGYKDKLTHAGYYGIDMSINTIEDFMEVDIDYYVKVGFSTVTKLVDILGGIDVYSDLSFKPLHSNTYVNEGMNHMDGELALAFARERKAYIGGDRHRIQNQQDVLSAIIKKLTSSKELVTNYTSILDALKDCFETNFETKDMTNLVKLQLDKMPSWNIKTYNVNGYDSSGYTYSYGDNSKLWVMEPNYETVKKASDYINGMKQRKSFSELGL